MSKRMERLRLAVARKPMAEAEAREAKPAKPPPVQGER